MQEIATRIDQLEEKLCGRLDTLEDLVQKLVCNTMSAGEKNALRRQCYAAVRHESCGELSAKEKRRLVRGSNESPMNFERLRTMDNKCEQ